MKTRYPTLEERVLNLESMVISLGLIVELTPFDGSLERTSCAASIGTGAKMIRLMREKDDED